MKYNIKLVYRLQYEGEIEADNLEDAIEKARIEWNDHSLEDYTEIEGDWVVIDYDHGNILFGEYS